MTKFPIATAALMAGTAALAQTAPVAPPPPSAPMIHPMDDRVMTRDEVVVMVRDHFGRLDADRDGAITTTEVMQGHEKMAERWRESEPGVPHTMMMREGPMGDPNTAFDRLDANKDGSISRDEFAKAHEQRIERRIKIREERKEARNDGKLPDRREFRMHHMGGWFGGRMIVMADRNHDGRITLSEAEAMALQHFDQMDANHDGKVTPEERQAGRPMIIKKMIEEKKTNG
jgi:Ca2+-binding EF-hand superfamily protein